MEIVLCGLLEKGKEKEFPQFNAGIRMVIPGGIPPSGPFPRVSKRTGSWSDGFFIPPFPLSPIS